MRETAFIWSEVEVGHPPTPDQDEDVRPTCPRATAPIV
jgi:hypothetical protein